MPCFSFFFGFWVQFYIGFCLASIFCFRHVHQNIHLFSLPFLTNHDFPISSCNAFPSFPYSCLMYTEWFLFSSTSSLSESPCMKWWLPRRWGRARSLCGCHMCQASPVVNNDGFRGGGMIESVKRYFHKRVHYFSCVHAAGTLWTSLWGVTSGRTYLCRLKNTGPCKRYSIITGRTCNTIITPWPLSWRTDSTTQPINPNVSL